MELQKVILYYGFTPVADPVAPEDVAEELMRNIEPQGSNYYFRAWD